MERRASNGTWARLDWLRHTIEIGCSCGAVFAADLWDEGWRAALLAWALEHRAGLEG